MRKERGKEENTQQQQGYDRDTLYAHIGMPHYIVSYSEPMVATTIIVITVKDSWFHAFINLSFET